MHDQTVDGYLCKICNKTLHTKGSLVRHNRVHHCSLRPFECSKCLKKFKTKKDLKVIYSIYELLHSIEK